MSLSDEASPGYAIDESYDAYSPDRLDTPIYPESTSLPSTNNSTADRKVIFTYDYQLETTAMDETLLALESAVASTGGYIEKSQYSGRDNSDQYSYATLTCRIPTKAVDIFKEAVETAGHVRSKNEQGRDITDEYYDIEAHLKTLYAQEERLLALLQTSGDLSDIIELERELTRVRTEIERLTGALNKYDNLVDLCTFTITIYNVSTFSPPSEESFLTRLGRAARESFQYAISLGQNLVIALVYLFPYLLLVGLVLFIIRIFIRRYRRKNPVPQLVTGPPIASAFVPSYPPPDSNAEIVQNEGPSNLNQPDDSSKD
ncbi:MAG: DUF4349 domain-containing protein [Coriobacteriia bacterium]|nr:DUF4349 domain-containing protein [Coriobacteriia bacterium]